MDVFILVIWLYVAAAERRTYPENIEEFIKEYNHPLKQRHRPLYHLSPPVGWISAPAGFAYFKQHYHVFFQYHPYIDAWNPVYLGHAVSENLIDWTYYPTAIATKEHYDNQGCLAGSAVVYNDFITLFYTGSVVLHNKTHQSQNVAISGDGVIYQKYLYNPIIRKGPHSVQDFRNPMVWRYRRWWYMLVGSSSNKNGELLLYSSRDMFNWKFNATIAQSFGDMGYVWENPDFFELNEQNVLILSVRGIPAEGSRFKNYYQSGYVIGNSVFSTGQFNDLEVSTATFKELDYGHDFYAPKTFEAVDGRRLLIAWLGMWDSSLEESKDGWASMLTLIREVKVTCSGQVMMTPMKEVTELRAELLDEAWYYPGDLFKTGSKSFEMIVNSTTAVSDAMVIFEWNGEKQFTLGYFSERGQMVIDRGGPGGLRQADWTPNGHIFWRIFVDSSSIEIFCGAGDVVFTSRIYPKKSIYVRIGGSTQLQITLYRLRRSVGYDINLKQYLKEHFVITHE